MTGIEVLYKEPIMDFNTLSWVFTWGGLGLLILCAILCAVNSKTKRNKIFSRCTWVGIIIGIVFFIGSCFEFPFFMELDGYKYHCTISDEVDFLEFYEKYEVIEQNEDLWVIQEKEIKE